MENVTSIEVKQLQSEGKKVLVDFWAPWCGPCRSLIPRLEGLESKYPNVTFVKLNVDENMDYAMELGVRTVPTVIVYNGEELVHRSTGANQEIVYTKVLDSL